MPSLILKMASSSQLSINHLLPKNAHLAKISRQTSCGKTVFILDLLQGPYQGFFRHIMLLCPTIEHNKIYRQCPWLWTDPEVYVLDPGERLHDYPTLFVIDNCSATEALTKKRDTLSEIVFSGRHADISVWVVSQRYNAVLKDLHEQTPWVCLFHCKDRDSFEDCLRENYVIPTREQWALVQQQLAETKHAKLLLKTDQPAAHMVLTCMK